MSTQKSKRKTEQRKQNRLLFGFIILVVLLVIWILRSLFREVGYRLPDIKKPTSVTKIELRKGVGELVTVIFTNSNWVILPEEYIADRNVMEDMVDKIKNFTLSDLISRGGSLSGFNLDENNRVEIKAYDEDKVVLHFYMGKTSSTFRHTYVMIDGDRSVYQAKGNFSYLFDRTPDSIKSMVVSSIPPEEVESINITDGRKKYTIEKIEIKESQTNLDSLVWKASWKKKSLDRAKWEDFLRKITPLSASGIQKGVFKGNEGFIRKIEIKTKKEDVTIFVLKQEKDKTYITAVKGNPALFQLPEQRGKDILTSIEEF